MACTHPATDPIAFPALLPLPLPLRGPAVRIDRGVTGWFSFSVSTGVVGSAGSTDTSLRSGDAGFATVFDSGAEAIGLGLASEAADNGVSGSP